MSNKIVEIQKQQNTKKILQIIRESNGISKTRLKEIVGLSFATVSSICNDLVAKDILREESSPTPRTAGRIPMRLFLKERSNFAICLDFQNQGSVKASIQDIAKTSAFSYVHFYEHPEEIHGVIHEIAVIILDKGREMGIQTSRYIGVGAAIAGIFDRKTETIQACAIAQWDGLPLKELLQNAFGMPAYVDNEANLCVSQLISFPTSKRNSQNVVYMHMGEGIGVGIIEGGRLVRGETGYAAEISHLPIGDKTLKCDRCGNYGCAETELSKKGFINKFQHASCKQSDTSLTWDDFVTAVRQGDKAALQVVKANTRLISDCVITLMILFDPQVFFIGGSIVDIYEYFEAEVSKSVARLGHHYNQIPIQIEVEQNQALTNGIIEMLIWRWEP